MRYHVQVFSRIIGFDFSCSAKLFLMIFQVAAATPALQAEQPWIGPTSRTLKSLNNQILLRVKKEKGKREFEEIL
jgi:hypothetical protein